MSIEKKYPVPSSADSHDIPLTFSIEICGVRSGCRHRPVLNDRFLIGSDRVCDLRVDDRLAAPLHCLLRADGDRLEVERLTAAPIFVDGVPVDHALIDDGATITIGPARLVIHTHAACLSLVRPTDERVASSCSIGEDPNRTVHRTATELIDLIEFEHDRVREFAERREAGAAALLNAVRGTNPPDSIAIAAKPLVAGQVWQHARGLASPSEGQPPLTVFRADTSRPCMQRAA